MIELDRIEVHQGAFGLRGVSLAITRGTYALFTGRTGSGKTTILEIIAGLRRSRAGRVRLRGQDVSDWPAAHRGIGYVPQDYALFRPLTVRENLAFGLSVRGHSRTECDKVIAPLAQQLGLTPILDRPAARLSGGESARVALGRALAFQPDLLLLDEPLNAVDAETLSQIVKILEDLKRSGKTTVLHVTHEPEPIVHLADERWHLAEGTLTRCMPVRTGSEASPGAPN
jgi:ABC-type sugar transport system ATPase subunit